MTSLSKANSNRLNTRASTGPKSSYARRRSARNALRHGLSVPVRFDTEFSESIEALARAIAGRSSIEQLQRLAHDIAEAQVDLCRVRQARHRLLSEALNNRYYDYFPETRRKVEIFGSLLRSEEMPSARVTEILEGLPQGPRKFATVLSQESMQLMKMERYERRALSRLRSAIRAFDEARSHVATNDRLDTDN